MRKIFFKRKEEELLWCLVVKNPLANAGNTSSIPGLEKIPRFKKQLRPFPATGARALGPTPRDRKPPRLGGPLHG